MKRWFRSDPPRKLLDPDEEDRVVAIAQTHPIEVEHALACGAHRQVMNGQPWNLLGPAGVDTMGERRGLAEDWGITSTAELSEIVDALADPDQASQGDDVFAVRRTMRARGEPTDVEAWVAELGALNLEYGVDPEVGAALVAEARRVAAYEGLLRERGLLESDDQVSSLYAWDWARGANLARDGLAAGYCDQEGAENAAVVFSRLVRANYTSWADFGVAFTLGRLLWSYDRYEVLVDWGSSVDLDRTIGLQQILISDPESPWCRIPFHLGADAAAPPGPAT